METYRTDCGGYWVLSRYSDVQAAVLDTGLYSSAGGLTVRYDERAAAWLRQQARIGSRIGALGSGAVFTAKTGFGV